MIDMMMMCVFLDFERTALITARPEPKYVTLTDIYLDITTLQ
jgi:hypothetical protein